MLEEWVSTYQVAVPHDKRDKYVSQARYKTSLTDADATLLRKSSHLGYHTHYVVDGGKRRIILGALWGQFGMCAKRTHGIEPISAFMNRHQC